ncbi:MAG: carbohydrate binding domain-containing protein, partial [Sedimentisphaerales bacterium]|nr:carbohydrate binding domain-containing protein [Sedimentisphaerales bacterium]
STWPNGIWDQKDPTRFSSEALDRLDFFIHQLAKHGIMIDLNLHVGRAHSRYLGLPQPNTDYDKIVGIFTPALIDAQKRFAQELLSHRNPYRANVRYADDPAIAIVEITNEDSFFMWSGDQDLRALPPFYAAILQGQFNGYLKAKYGSHQALADAWSQGVQPLGEEMLINGSLAGQAAGWRLEQHNNCKAQLTNTIYNGQQALKITVLQHDGTDWHLQLNQGNLAVKAGSYYTISFKAAAQQPRTIICNVGQDHDPWKTLGLWRQLELGTQWQTFTIGLVATEDDHNARLNIAFGNDSTAFYLADVQFRPGGQVAVAPGEDLDRGTVAIFQANESTPRILDRMLFLAQTEKAYFDQIRRYIKDQIGCQALVTGTIVFGPLGLYAQSDMDFIDSHAYWQHPQFPGRPWDPDNWIVEQVSMTDRPGQSTLVQLAAQRLAGRPYTVSEYNHPAPNDYQAECVPMIASFAALQDWDGVWLYTYSHSNDQPDRQYLNSFFDVDTNPAKWGFMRAGACLFAGQGLGPLTKSMGVGLTEQQEPLAGLAALHMRYDRDLTSAVTSRLGLGPNSLITTTVEIALAGPIVARYRDSAYPSTSIIWQVIDGQGVYYAYGPGGWVCTGHATRISDLTRGRLGVTSPEFASIAVAALDSDRLETATKVLVTACGRCENVDMGFSADRRTVGRQWGKGPVHIEAVTGKVMLGPGPWRCQALGPDGAPKAEVPLEAGPALIISPRYNTMWYLLTR